MGIEKRINKELLPYVGKPGRYIGEELFIIKKPLTKDTLRIGLIFPDVYELGMSYVGFKILYEITNRLEFAYTERIFAPWFDAENILREKNIPLFSLETKSPIKEFDVLGFTLQYELSYTNILNILDLGGIPLYSKERNETHPIIIGGGPGAFNPEPIADFFDLFLLGDGEFAFPEVLKIIHEGKKYKETKENILKELVKIQGIYVPEFYNILYEGNHIKNIETINNAPLPVKKAIVKNLDDVPFPEKPIVPFIKTVHDRAPLEIFRGCDRGCRFCQAGMVYRPVRERSLNNLLELSKKILKNTGYEDISLISLSTSDYSNIESLINGLLPYCQENFISISLPSLRVDTFSINLSEKVSRIKKTGLTFAVEAGTDRLRNVINKNITEKNLMESAKSAFEMGWNLIKFYFMIGLPTETKEDILAIAELAKKIESMGRKIRKRSVNIKISVSPFVPKPHTPFQWERQNEKEELDEKISLLKKAIRGKRNIILKYRDTKLSTIEGVFSRGDRRLSKALYIAQKEGQIMDGWEEGFSYEKWIYIFNKSGINYKEYLMERDLDDLLPWDHLSSGVKKDFLKKELEKAKKEILTEDCRFSRCTDCGVCPLLKVRNILSGEKA